MGRLSARNSCHDDMNPEHFLWTLSCVTGTFSSTFLATEQVSSSMKPADLMKQICLKKLFINWTARFCWTSLVFLPLKFHLLIYLKTESQRMKETPGEGRDWTEGFYNPAALLLSVEPMYWMFWKDTVTTSGKHLFALAPSILYKENCC